MLESSIDSSGPASSAYCATRALGLGSRRREFRWAGRGGHGSLLRELAQLGEPGQLLLVRRISSAVTSAPPEMPCPVASLCIVW